jgi:hypothetical protein
MKKGLHDGQNSIVKKKSLGERLLDSQTSIVKKRL